MLQPQDVIHSEPREAALLRGRVAIVFALSRNYLFVPFAVLSLVATVLHHGSVPPYATIPFVLLITAGFAGNRVADSYERAQTSADPSLWARRLTLLSFANGAVWGLGAIVWFVPGSFAEEAYLVLAMLGMSSTEFLARVAYRPAYLVHATASLAPLALMLAWQGGTYQTLTAMLVLFYVGALYSFSDRVGELLDQCVTVRYGDAARIASLSSEKADAVVRRDAAQASDRAKSAFIANISHELRTPLNAILGMAQLLERSDLEKAQRDHVRVLLESGRGLKTLLDDVIALAQDERESLAAPEEGCDAAQAARTVVRLLQPNAWEKRLRLSMNIASGLPRVAADPRNLRRILLKLVSNAIKFTERGNVEVALSASTGPSDRKMIRICVIDTGPGVPQHLLHAIFEPFGKPDDTHPGRRTGAGVGLAVAKQLVESLGGEIGVESEPGMGAQFWITLPATTVTPLHERDDQIDVPPPQGLSLLLFLPDGEMRSAIEDLLAPWNNRITVANSLVEASACSARGGFSAAIVTAAAADALAAVPGQSTAVLAIATSDERSPDGAAHVLRWPVGASALYGAIQALTGESGAGSEIEDDDREPAVDAKAFAELEKSLGFKTLVDILQSYLKTAEDLATALTAASAGEDWKEAGRVAQDFAGAAGGLGLAALTAAARALAQGARDGAAKQKLLAASGEVLSEHRRVNSALRRLYPDLSA